MPLPRIVYLLLLGGLFTACSTKKNTVVSRAYHNLTARYNGYYYSNEAISDGLFKIEKNNKENFDKVLPVYIYAPADKVKNTFPEFDKSIKKSSVCIQKHTIKDGNGNEAATAGKWIDNNWINIGVSHFYKREYFSGIEAFEYVIRTYTKSKDKYQAMLWLIRANNEIGAVSSSEPIISLLKNERHLPISVRTEFPIVVADYYLRRGQNIEAMAKLMEATRNTNLLYGVSRKRRARYCFIIAQLAEQLNEKNRAVEYYRKTIALKPNYDMIFYSKIKVARLMDAKHGNPAKTKKDLLRMTKEFKNSDYYDVIFYTLGELEERDKNNTQALAYYKRSVQTSVNNPNQKALSFLRMGEINFDLTNYVPAGSYYDSAVAALPKDHPDYDRVVQRKKTLEALVGHINTIHNEDSLQQLARMSSDDRDKYIDRMIEKMKADEERKLKELEAAKNSQVASGGGSTLPGGSTIPGFGGQGTSFYFYNPNTVAIGISEFTKKWGNRKLEDNWRRSNKALSIDEADNGGKGPKGKDSLSTSKNGKYSSVQSREFYLKNLPLTDSAISKSNKKIIKAYYQMGSIYKEELNNSKKTVATFEELNKRFPDNKYKLNTYYMLYRVFLAEKNDAKAEYYKNKILEEFPDSEFALLIKNPEVAQELNAKKSVVENFYADTYKAYHAGDYVSALAQSKEGISRFGKNDYLPKFEFIRATSYGKLKGVDSLEYSLKLLVAKYPSADITPLANDILTAVKKQKNPELFKEPETNKASADTFAVDLDSEHFVVAFTPDESKKADAFKTNVGSFNGVYYANKKFDMASNLYGQSNQMIIIKSFANAKEAANYVENLMADPDLFKGDVKKEEISIFPILPSNMQLLYKKKNLTSYKAFYEDNYKKLTSKNQ